MFYRSVPTDQDWATIVVEMIIIGPKMEIGLI